MLLIWIRQWSSFQSYLVCGIETLTDHLNGLGCCWVASYSSPFESEESSSYPSGLLGPSENSTSFIWESVELFGAPPCALSFISDVSCNIDFSSKSTSLLIKALLVSGSQSLKPLTPLVNPMKTHLLDLDSSLFFFTYQPNCTPDNRKSVQLNNSLTLLAISPLKSEDQLLQMVICLIDSMHDSLHLPKIFLTCRLVASYCGHAL